MRSPEFARAWCMRGFFVQKLADPSLNPLLTARDLLKVVRYGFGATHDQRRNDHPIFRRIFRAQAHDYLCFSRAS